MKKVLLIAVTIVTVIALGNVLLASAQGGTLPWQQNGTCPISGYTCPYTSTQPFPGGMMGGFANGMMGGRIPGGMMGAYGVYTGTLPYGGMMGMHNFMMGTNGMHVQVWTAVAQELGLTYEQLLQATQNGQTVAQLAEAAGVSLADLKQAAITAHQNSLADLVEQGFITQAQADWMLDHLDAMPMFNFGQGFGPGMLNGWNNGVAPNGYGPGMMGRGMMRGWQQPTGPQG